MCGENPSGKLYFPSKSICEYIDDRTRDSSNLSPPPEDSSLSHESARELPFH
jgi:hypothetical protein